MNLKLKHISMIAMLLMIILFTVSCSPSTTDTQPTTQPAQSTPGQTESKPDPFGRYETPVTLTTVFATNPATETFLQHSQGETVEKNRWIDLIKERLNIEVKYTVIVEGSQLDQKLNIMIASGDIPDFLQVSPIMAKQMYDADLIIPVDDLFEQYASDQIKEFHDIDERKSWTAFEFDGVKVGIPRVGFGEPIGNVKMIWLRNDWLKEVGLPEPETMEDLIEVARAFVTKDPDRDGANDTVGFGAIGDIFSSACHLQGFFNGYGAYPTLWLEDDSGNLVPGVIQPEVKKVLEMLQNLYAENLIDQEFSIKRQAQLKEDVVAERCGLFIGVHSNMLHYGFAELKEANPDSDWICLPLPGKLSLQSPATSLFASATVISKNCKYPEAVQKIMNLHNQMQSGTPEEASRYIINEKEGNVTFMCPVPAALLPFKNITIMKTITEAFKIGDPELAYERVGKNAQKTEYMEHYLSCKKYLETKDPIAYPWFLAFGPEEYRTSQSILDYYLKNADAKLLENKYNGPKTPTMVEKEPVLNTLRDETFIQIIMGQRSVDEFDKFVEDWKNLGGNDITREVNDWYQRNKK